MQRSAEIQRLFFALWPTDEVRADIAEVRSELEGLAGRPVALEQIHQTLLFVGNADAVTRLCMEAAASEVTTVAFTLCLDRLGHWSKPQVCWLGASTTPPALSELAEHLRRGAQACGVQVERRPFAVHLTLARKVRRRPPLAESFSPVMWPIHEFVLVVSRLRPTGPEYEIVRRWVLA